MSVRTTTTAWSDVRAKRPVDEALGGTVEVTAAFGSRKVVLSTKAQV